MKDLIYVTIWQLLLLLLLITKDKNDGEKKLFKEQKWKAVDVLIIVFSINIFVYIVYFLSQVHTMYSILNVSRPFLIHLFILLLLVAFFRFRFKQSLRVLGFTKNNLRKIIGLGVAVAIINYFSFTVLYFLIGEPGTYGLDTIEELKSIEGLTDYMLYIFTDIIFVPLVEEGFFRGILYSPYRKKYGSFKAIIITALFFSMSHLGVGALPFIIGGVLKGALYEKTESLISPIVAHSTYNLITFLTVIYLLK